MNPVGGGEGKYLVSQMRIGLINGPVRDYPYGDRGARIGNAFCRVGYCTQIGAEQGHRPP